MSKSTAHFAVWVGLAGTVTSSCAQAHADRARPIEPRVALSDAPARVRAPYEVSVLSDAYGGERETFYKNGRYYVLGVEGEAYSIHVTNPTDRRVEAVISVDGLDVVDGENGDMRKRGYIIAPYGELNVSGFRTSLSDVATFRFASVGNSYAGRKGKARNVGVIAVAIFEEQGTPALASPSPISPPPYRYDWKSDVEGHGKAAGAPRDARISADRPAAPAPYSGASAAGASNKAAQAPSAAALRDGDEASEATAVRAVRPRAGLGTEFGESRYSPTQYTQFVRASTRPVAIAELRYNDVHGLIALGIPVELPPAYEVELREQANPFPGDGHFARPVR